jgi:hypothetical protein
MQDYILKAVLRLFLDYRGLFVQILSLQRCCESMLIVASLPLVLTLMKNACNRPMLKWFVEYPKN